MGRVELGQDGPRSVHWTAFASERTRRALSAYVGQWDEP